MSDNLLTYLVSTAIATSRFFPSVFQEYEEKGETDTPE